MSNRGQKLNEYRFWTFGSTGGMLSKDHILLICAPFCAKRIFFELEFLELNDIKMNNFENVSISF
jgi:hypothetical protein